MFVNLPVHAAHCQPPDFAFSVKNSYSVKPNQ